MLFKRISKFGLKTDTYDPDPYGPRSAAISSLVTIADQAIVSLTTFITIVVLAKYSGDSIFASFALVWQAINYLRTTQERLISAPYLVFVHRPKQSPETLLGSNLSHDFFFAVGSSLIMLAIGLIMKLTGHLEDSAFGLITLAFAIPGLLIRDHLRIVSFANFRSDLAFIIDILASSIQLAGIGFLAYLGQMQLIYIALVLGISGYLPIALWFASNPLRIKINLDQLIPDWLTCWRYSKWLVFARCLGIGAYLIIPWIIVILKGDIATGAFASCLSLVGLSTMFVTGLNNFLQPASIRAFHQGGRRALLKSMAFSYVAFSAVLIPLCFVYYFFGSELLGFIYKKQYAAEHFVVFILGINVLAFSFAIIAGNGLAALERPEGNFWGELTNLIVSTSLAVYFIDRFGLSGAAAAITIGSIVASIVTIVSFIRIIRSIPDPTLQIASAA